jgi:gliding motility-associated-like protein
MKRVLEKIGIFFICTLSILSIAQTSIPMRGCALPGPNSTCTKMESNGDLTLSWTKPTDPNNIFVRYEVYRLGTNGAIVSIPTFTNSNSTTINSFFANSEFYVGVVSLCSGMEVINFGDTVKTIDLELRNQTDGRADLTWTTPSKSNTNFFHVERENPKFGWSSRDSVKNTLNTYTDTIDVCSAFLNYRISIKKEGCTSYSILKGDNFNDVIPPTIPVIKSITYDTLKKGITINWYKNPARDVKGYLLKIGYDNSPLSFLDSVETKKNIEPLSYNLVNAPYNSAITFSIAAYDSCLSSSPPNNQLSGNSQPHTGFNLKYTYTICNRAISLNWSKYIGWDEIKNYRIYYKIDNGYWKLRDSTVNQYYYDSLIGFKNYSFIIEAISKDNIKAFSNPINFIAQAPSLPKFNYTKVAKVMQNVIQLEHLIDKVGGVSQIILEKKNKSGIFKEVSRKDVTNSILYFTDSLVETNFETYTYRTRILDSCGNKTTYGNEVTSMLLKIENKQNDNDNLKINLSWSPYLGFNGTILNYAVYRKLNGVYEPNPIAIIPNYQLSYQDNLIDLIDFDGQVCYYITAIESENAFKQPAIANTNEVCTTFKPLIFVPNAFTPNGKNPIFHPVISLFEPKEYSLTIINRWGQPVFRSVDYKVGWDGNFGNEMSPNGNYMYVIRYLDGDNKEFIEHGFVTLIN